MAKPTFNAELPEWKRVGVKPDQTYIDNGWQPTNKPPAEWLNWLFNRAFKAIEEIRNAIKDWDMDTKVNKSGDTMTGALTLSGAPTQANHATTKAYVDGLTPDLSSRVAKSGDTMTGALTLSGAPTQANHAATKTYVDGLSLWAGATKTADKFYQNATAPTGATETKFDGIISATKLRGSVLAADFAETVPYEDAIPWEPGHLLMVNPDKDDSFCLARSSHSGLVVGVVSGDEEFGSFVGPDPSPEFAPLGLCGRNRPFVIGPVRVGDEIVVSGIPGVGEVFEISEIEDRSSRLYHRRAKGIVGKAVETNLDPGVKRVRVMIH